MLSQIMPATPSKALADLGLMMAKKVHYQLPPEELTEQALERKQGVLNDTGALVINTGEFNGRCPKEKFTVLDMLTEDVINWNEFNIPIEPIYFERMYDKMMDHLSDKEIWMRDCYACADENYRINIRVINEDPWSNLFAYNMFLRPDDELENFKPDWQIIQAPTFKANPKIDGTNQHNFVMVSFSKKIILIGGTGYTGEIKKGIFSILNYILPHDKDVLSMHCSANMGDDGDTAIFFGLSGTGKTTLSTDPKRYLIGDDEHGWADDCIFNFEGGCYAKAFELSEEEEPEIFHAIRPGALVENVSFHPGTNVIDFSNKKITENTRVSYPLHYIGNSLGPSVARVPKNIFFLTCDAYGIFPPISKLDPQQAMYQFISGYTAKVAGTETGVIEPKATFSACFGAPFLPLHPGYYAAMLGKKIKENKVNVWMVNTGWSGGGFNTGKRIQLAHTRAIITAVLEGKLNNVAYKKHPVFGMMMPTQCPDVPTVLLDPRNTWADQNAYDVKAKDLAKQFIKNFEKYAANVNKEILTAAPII